ATEVRRGRGIVLAALRADGEQEPRRGGVRIVHRRAGFEEGRRSGRTEAAGEAGGREPVSGSPRKTFPETAHYGGRRVALHVSGARPGQTAHDAGVVQQAIRNP